MRPWFCLCAQHCLHAWDAAPTGACDYAEQLPGLALTAACAQVLLVCWVCVHGSLLLALLSAVLRLLLAARAQRPKCPEKVIVCEHVVMVLSETHLACLTPVGLLLWSWKTCSGEV